MAQYVLERSNWTAASLPNAIGQVYNVGLSDGTVYYGYVLKNDGPQSKGFLEKTDIAERDALVNYGSPNLVDRDLTFYPRASQGDFSGGGLQPVFINPNQYWDSDLEVRTPAYLTLRPAWANTGNLATGLGAVTPQSVTWQNDVWTTFQGSVIVNSSGTTRTPPITPKFLATDGWVLYVADGTNNIYFASNSGFGLIANASGALTQIWAITQGTNGRFVYGTVVHSSQGSFVFHDLYKFDTTIAPAPAVQVPTGLNEIAIIDICAYQSGIAILSMDSSATGCDVWYHDGANMTRIVRLEEYSGSGLCVCLGDLYVTGQSVGQYEGPVLMQIASGTFQIVARPASPLAQLTAASVGAPISSGQYVYFALSSPQISGISSASYIGVYDALTGAFSHLGNAASTDAPGVASPRQLTAIGRAVAYPQIVAGNGSLNYQTNQSRLAAGNTYTPSGWLVSSNFDFSTPGIAKRFRRIEVHHAPLNTGEQIKVNAYVDLDPINFTTALAPNPATATVTNSTLGSTLTVLTMGADTVGRTLYYAIQLTAGTGGATSPRVIWVAVEVGGSWTWTLDLDCTSKRRTLAQSEDGQGVTGKDLYFLLRNSYENGNYLTLYLSESVSYTVAIESLQAQSLPYADHPDLGVRADQEWQVQATLRQVA